MKERRAPAERPGEIPAVSGEEPMLLGQREANYVQVACPVCSAAGAIVRTVRLDVPFFGEVFETVFICSACGFRHADTLIPRVSEPVEFALRVEQKSDLFVRAVKSSSATVAVPELGLLWEPGPASIAEVTNVEGLLRHFEDAVERAVALFATDDVRAKGKALCSALDDVIENRRGCEILLKDPYGNSALIDPKGRVARRILPQVEASQLLTGEYVFEMSGGEPSSLRPKDPAGAHQ